MAFAARVARNTLVQVVGKVVGASIGLIVVALLTRYLHETGFGQYATVLAYVGFASVVADLGLFLVANRELALPGADKPSILGNLVGIRLTSAVALLGLGALLAFVLPYPEIVKQGILITTLAFLCVAVTQLLVAVFQVHTTMWPVVTGEFLGRLILLAGVAYGVSHGWSILDFLSVQVVANAAAMLVSLFAVRKFVPLRPRFDPVEWRRILTDTLPIALSVILNLIYFRIDTIFLSLFKSADVVGLYAAAYKVLEVLAQFPAMFVGLVLPALSAAWLDPARFKEIFQRAFDAIALAALPIVVGGMILAEPLMRFVNGDAFAAAAPYFRILLVAVGCLYLGSLSGHTIVAIRKQRVMVWGYLTVAALGVALYLVLIPRLSATGAAIGTVATEVTISTIGYAIILRTMKFRLNLVAVAKGAVAALGMAIALILLPQLHVLVRLLIGATAYVGIILLTRAVSVGFVREVLALRGNAPVGAVEELP